jgi:hypothetical protein
MAMAMAHPSMVNRSWKPLDDEQHMSEQSCSDKAGLKCPLEDQPRMTRRCIAPTTVP